MEENKEAQTIIESDVHSKVTSIDSPEGNELPLTVNSSLPVTHVLGRNLSPVNENVSPEGVEEEDDSGHSSPSSKSSSLRSEHSGNNSHPTTVEENTVDSGNDRLTKNDLEHGDQENGKDLLKKTIDNSAVPAVETGRDVEIANHTEALVNVDSRLQRSLSDHNANYICKNEEVSALSSPDRTDTSFKTSLPRAMSPLSFEFAMARKRRSLTLTNTHVADNITELIATELMKLRKKAELKDDEYKKLLEFREKLEADVIDLTADLFSDANQKVSVALAEADAAVKEKERALKLKDEAEKTCEVLLAEVEALKMIVLTSTPSRPNPHLHPQIGPDKKSSSLEKNFTPTEITTNHHAHSSSYAGVTPVSKSPNNSTIGGSGKSIFKKDKKKNNKGNSQATSQQKSVSHNPPPPRYLSTLSQKLGHRRSQSHQENIIHYAQNTPMKSPATPTVASKIEYNLPSPQTPKREDQSYRNRSESDIIEYIDTVDPLVYKEFQEWRSAPCIGDESPFIRRLLADDVKPAFGFANSVLADEVLQGVRQNSLTIEPISETNNGVGSPSFRETFQCALMLRPTASRFYRMRVSDTANEQIICQMARDRITTVADLFGYLRWICQGLLNKNSSEKLFMKIAEKRKNVCLSRLGFPFPSSS